MAVFGAFDAGRRVSGSVGETKFTICASSRRNGLIGAISVADFDDIAVAALPTGVTD